MRAVGVEVTDDGYFEGAPELIVEITASSVSYDLHQKKRAYRRNGVQEYLVHRTEDGEVDWFILKRGKYVRQQADVDGLLKSRVFPGLWLDVDALLNDDQERLRLVVERGCATPEHARFRAHLRGRSE